MEYLYGAGVILALIIGSFFLFVFLLSGGATPIDVIWHIIRQHRFEHSEVRKAHFPRALVIKKIHQKGVYILVCASVETGSGSSGRPIYNNVCTREITVSEEEYANTKEQSFAYLAPGEVHQKRSGLEYSVKLSPVSITAGHFYRSLANSVEKAKPA
jgi:hypothetical protein